MKFTFILPEEMWQIGNNASTWNQTWQNIFLHYNEYSIFMLQFRNIRCLVTYQQNTTRIDVKIHRKKPNRTHFSLLETVKVVRDTGSRWHQRVWSVELLSRTLSQKTLYYLMMLLRDLYWTSYLTSYFIFINSRYIYDV